MTWDPRLFPDPVAMQQQLAATSRKLVTIIDPHVKREKSYPLFVEAESRRFYVRDRTGSDFNGYVQDCLLHSMWAQ